MKKIIVLFLILLMPFTILAASNEATLTIDTVDLYSRYIPNGKTEKILYSYDGDGEVKCDSSNLSYVTCMVDNTNKVIVINVIKKLSKDIAINIYATKGSKYNATEIIKFIIKSTSELTNVKEIKPVEICRLKRDSNTLAMQGVYFFKEKNIDYAIYAGFTSDTSEIILTLVDLKNCKVIARNNEMVLGHANDITYNSKEKMFYVLSSEKQHVRTFTVDVSNKKIIYNKDITMPISLSGIAYNENNNEYYSRIGNSVYSINSNKTEYTKIGSFKTKYDGFSLTSQGIAYDDNNIYAPRCISATRYKGSHDYNSNYVFIYDIKSLDYKYAYKIPNKTFEAHLEGVSIIDDYLYLGYNLHTGTKSQVFFKYMMEKANGDVNNDGKVTSTDYIIVRKHILKQTKLTVDAFIRGDLNGDNKITSVDYIAIRKIILNT